MHPVSRVRETTSLFLATNSKIREIITIVTNRTMMTLVLNVSYLRQDICGHCMVVGFITTYAISDYHHWCCEFKSRSGKSVQHHVIKFFSRLATGRLSSLGPLLSCINKTDRHDITEILLKVPLNTIKPTNLFKAFYFWKILVLFNILHVS